MTSIFGLKLTNGEDVSIQPLDGDCVVHVAAASPGYRHTFVDLDGAAEPAYEIIAQLAYQEMALTAESITKLIRHV